jgi:hypothetical protein
MISGRVGLFLETALAIGYTPALELKRRDRSFVRSLDRALGRSVRDFFRMLTLL